MSYDIFLRDPVSKEVLHSKAPHFMQGGTYVVGGTDELWLNVTYNYGDIFCSVMGKDGIHIIEGKTGAQTIPIFKSAIAKLNDDVDDDYWKPTEGNAKRPLYQLLAFAEMRPDGIWEIE